MHREEYQSPLLDESILSNSSDSDLLSIIEDSPDVNITNQDGDTALHFAVKRESITVPLELIKRGANINANGKKGLTPLHLAVDYCNIEAVGLLLYYNVDVTVVCQDNKVAFMNALDFKRSEIAYLLLNYYEKFPARSCYGKDTVLLIFARNLNPIAIDLVYKGVDVNSIDKEGCSAIMYSIRYKSPALFKLLWVKIDHNVLFLTKIPFLIFYFEQCSFNKDDWLDCLYLVLEGDRAFELIEHCINVLAERQQSTFFVTMWPSLKKMDIALNDRIKIIYIALTLGAEVYSPDIDWLVGYHFCEDVQVLGYHSTSNLHTTYNYNLLSDYFLFTCRPRSYTRNYIVVQLLDHVTYCINNNCLYNCIISVLKYFSLPLFLKKQLTIPIDMTNLERTSYLTRKVSLMPAFPTLTEICRNRVRIVIHKNCNITKPYQFYDVLKKLPLSATAKDILSFKLTLYV